MKATFCVIVLAGLCSAAMTQYTPWEYLSIKDKVIDVGSYGSPFVADWDNDGKQDLLVGKLRLGCRVDYFRNTGTNASPQLEPGIALKSDGSTTFAKSC